MVTSRDEEDYVFMEKTQEFQGMTNILPIITFKMDYK